MDHAPLQPPSLIDDPFEESTNRLRPERPLGRHGPHMPEHILLSVWLVDFDALLLFQLPDLTDTPGPLIQESHEHFVDPIDIPSQVFDRWHLCHAPPLAPFNHRT